MRFVDDEYLLLSRSGRTRPGWSQSVDTGPDRAQYRVAASPARRPAARRRFSRRRLASILRAASRRPAGGH